MSVQVSCPKVESPETGGLEGGPGTGLELAKVSGNQGVKPRTTQTRHAASKDPESLPSDWWLSCLT